jgi:hypothetical protein
LDHCTGITAAIVASKRSEMTPQDLKIEKNFFHIPDKHFSDAGLLL